MPPTNLSLQTGLLDLAGHLFSIGQLYGAISVINSVYLIPAAMIGTTGSFHTTKAGQRA